MVRCAGPARGLSRPAGAPAVRLCASAPALPRPPLAPRLHRSASSSPRVAAWAIPRAREATADIPTQGGSSARVRLEDPLRLLKSELSGMRQSITALLGSKHPALDTIAKYYFQAEGKHVRPMIVLLMSQATNGLSPRWDAVREREDEREQRRREGKGMGVDEPLEHEDVLQDENPSMAQRARDLLANPLSAFSSSSSSPSAPAASSASLNLLPTQRRLAEITELIHVASLLHDDVIDLAATRRSAPSAPSLFGNKLSILGGDFLLARASLALSRLGSNEVVELVASVLANLVEGEVMQMKGNMPSATSSSSSSPSPTSSALPSASSAVASSIVPSHTLSGRGPTPEIFAHYMRKTYLKTASLIAKSARATTILGGAGECQGWKEGEGVKDAAYEYGRNLGIAFQLIDDMLDFTASAAELGKPGGGADLKLGLATAPALYAWDEFPELGALIERKFAEEGDVERAKDLILRSSGAARTFALAEEHSNAAIAALRRLPESDARDALEKIARDVLTRKK
ncbi:trans-hexaprenyltranstransferase [Rhodotorula paludigena]|uniref:trans-hexaprenyltranstransferase n=1 Tax=Rhodotorula paludigena TaxID=86838 RepID=UPI0031822127